MSDEKDIAEQIKTVKVEIFDILRQQETFKFEIAKLDETKTQKVQELQKLEKQQTV